MVAAEAAVGPRVVLGVVIPDHIAVERVGPEYRFTTTAGDGRLRGIKLPQRQANAEYVRQVVAYLNGGG